MGEPSKAPAPPFTLAISLLPNIRARENPQRADVTLEQLTEALTNYEHPSAKHLATAWSPIVWNGHARIKDAVSVSCLVFDLDIDDRPLAMQALAETLEAGGWYSILHETWTRGRYRLTLPLAWPLLPNEYANAWESATRVIPGLLALADPSCRDLGHAYFVPSCPEGEERVSGTQGSPTKLFQLGPSRAPEATYARQPTPETRSAEPSAAPGSGATPRAGAVPEAPSGPQLIDLDSLRQRVKSFRKAHTRELLAQALNGRLSLRHGERDVNLHTVGSALPYLEVSEEVALAIIEPSLAGIELDAGEHPEEWREKFRSSFQRALARREKEDERTRQLTAFFRPSAPAEGADVGPEGAGPDDGWKEGLRYTTMKDGTPRLDNHTANLDLIFSFDPEWENAIRWNVLRRHVEVVSGPLESAVAETLDTAVSNFFFHPPWNSRITRDTAAAAVLHAAMQAPYDPVRNYLDGLPKWDGEPRISSLLGFYVEGPGNPNFLSTIGRKFLISAVARVYEPGCQADTVLVLQGGQGIGKTSFFRILSAGFHVETRLDVHNKDAVMVATSNWLVELAELASIQRSDIESVRSFLSAREDQIRLPYGRDVSTFPRRCVFVGTTNNMTPLTDREGNRRFWVVAAERVRLAELKADLEQIWAEAVAAYEAGEQWWLAGEETALQAEEAKLFEAEDPTSHLISTWLEQSKTAANGLTTYEIAARALKLMPNQISTYVTSNIARHLRDLGWTNTQKRYSGRSAVSMWYPPEKKS